MSIVQGFVKYEDSLYYSYSKAVEGHTIPGILQRYPVRTVNYFDFSSAVKQGPKFVDPVKKFPNMNEDHGKGSSIMERLKAALNKKGDPDRQFETFRKGYERMREDLGWRGNTALPVPNVGLNPALHGPEVAGVLGAAPGLDL